MKNSQLYFIHQYQIQYYDHNTTEGSHEFPLKNQLFFFFWTTKCQVFTDNYYTKFIAFK